ncbi:hypothetical protein [Parasitella parasitica]|uniref:Integrase catalytic domain-containing protein n=1 Tax=Parasitella parasitica TaxID=35722 RepID=A0A0B7N1C8_9FUNG|nr:hypothetical protein [Parasitella parasitica]
MGDCSNLSPSEERKLQSKAKKYVLSRDHHLYRQVGTDQRMVKLPFISERPGILQQVHEGHGHFGQHSTWSVLYRNFWWPTAYDEMKTHIASCHECQLYAPTPYVRSPVAGRSRNVFEMFKQFGVDYVGPFPTAKSGARYVLVVVEMFSRWPMAEVFTKFGPLTTILSDNGAHFANQAMVAYVKIVDARHKYTTPYHPETSGMVERLNGIKKLAHLKPKEWDTHLNTKLYAYRVRAHEAIGISPYELMFGILPNDPQQDPILQLRRRMGFERLFAVTNLRNEVIMEEKRKISLHEANNVVWFLPGTLVLKKKPIKQGKLDSNWVDKIYTVIAAYGNNTYQLVEQSKGRPLKRLINATQLKQY